ncbi:MAG: hypothetical protein Q9163_003856 [Psora crenata]
MSVMTRLFLFGEDSSDLRTRLRTLSRGARQDPLLSLLFQRVGSALRHEVASLAPIDRHNIPPFSTIDELNESSISNVPHAGVENALLCLSEIAEYAKYILPPPLLPPNPKLLGQDANFLRYLSQSPNKPEDAGPSLAVGFSTGSLAATAVALSPSISTLIPLAVEVCLISFRLGCYIQDAAGHLECRAQNGGRSGWSSLIVEITETDMQDILDAFHTEKTIPLPKRAFISAVDNVSITITAPSSTIHQLKQTSSCSSLTIVEQQSHGPYHASHLRDAATMQQILTSAKPSVTEFLSSYTLTIPLISARNHTCVGENRPATSVLEQVLDEILHEALKTSATITETANLLEEMQSSRCQIICCGSSKWQDELSTRLELKTEIDRPMSSPSLDLAPGVALESAPRNQKLAIVGMAGRFPDAADLEKFWQLLEAGRDVHRKVPKDRFDANTHFDPTGKVRNTSHTPFGCFIEEPGLFDPRFFNMSPREATQTDPMHRLGLASAYEALEMAGYVPNGTPSTRLDRIGTFYGQTSDDWREINAAQEIDTYFITGGVRAFAPGRINYHFKFTGPSFSIDTACSSSAAAIQLACTSLWAGDCDMAVAGGLNVMTNSDIFSGLSRGQFLSKTGNCQTYDNEADGYCRGDGIGTIILKRLEDAEAENDRILGVILGTATNHSSNAISITHPHAATQELLFKRVMDDAGLDPHDVDYVEMHGTGTQAGDGTEMRSVTNVFAPQSRAGTRARPLHLGSVKANVGHGEAVSGVTAMIKCLLMMQKNLIPPHCGIKKTINQNFPKDLNTRNVHIAFKPTPLSPSDSASRRIFVNNFSAAGGNTATLLEDAPARPAPNDDPRGEWIVAVSAKSKSALRANTRNLIQHIKQHATVRLPDLSYTTTARRIQHNYRIAFGCVSMTNAVDILASKLDDAIEPVPDVKRRVAFAYTGQGSHYTAVGKQLYDLSTTFRTDLATFDNIGLRLGYPSFLPLIKGEVDAKDLSPLVVQLGSCCIQMALTRWWASLGVKPDIVVGHSLGEYAALNAADVLSVSDTIYLVGERAKLLEEKCTPGSHAMLATKTSAALIQGDLVDAPEVEVACINGASETVLGGTTRDIDTLADKLTRQGMKCTKLNTPFAFHSSQVEPILEDFERLADSVQFNDPRIPIISPLQATVLTEAGSISPHYLSSNARRPVDFVGGLASAQQLGLINEQTAWIELGPHPVCLSFIKSELGRDVVAAPTLRRGVAPYKCIADSLSMLHLAGLSIDWHEYHRDFIDCVRMIDLPAYAFDDKTYWIQYTGDWNLHKGHVVGLPEPETPKLSTTTVQKIVSEVVDSDKATVIVESDISRPDLRAAISGHVVNGTALCPSSLYADMAMTVGEYMCKLFKPQNAAVQMNVCNMEVFKSLIANDAGDKSQALRLTGTADASGGRAVLQFSSGSEKAQVQHAKCYVEYGSGNAWLAQWQRQAYLINGRIDRLMKAASSGQAHRMLRGMAYKLFGAFVEYDQKYRGMEEVILDSPQLEATANISFQTTEADGHFVCNPYWIDSVCHLAGFIVNANDAVDSSKQVYVSHGWESMRFAEPLVAEKHYRSYVKMQPLSKDVVAGDVYILDGDRIIGLCGTLKFQCIPRSLLNTFLPPKGSVMEAKPATAAPRTSAKALASKTAKKDLTQPATPSRTSPPILERALEIIAAELGVPLSELADGSEFTSMGVDSLMSLAISGRIREDLDINFPTTVFTDYPSVGVLRDYLGQYKNTTSDVEGLIGDYESTSNSLSDSDDDDSTQFGSASTPPSAPGTPEEQPDSSSLSTIIRQTISDEMNIDMSELVSVHDLSTVGMDSLMALSILGKLREHAGLVLPADFLIENRGIRSIEKALHISPPEAGSKPQRQSKQKIATPMPNPASESDTGKVKHLELPERNASSVLLQGNPKTATKTFWLVPDGSGTPTSYTSIDDISKTVAIWGLTSPFLKTPDEYIVGIAVMASKFIKEIKRRQPKGPYHIGGWSAGGIISFEICQQLIAAEDVVDTLVFIDTPCPLIIEPLPGHLHRFFGSIGLLGEGDGALEKLPPWLLPHFAASVRALATYQPKRILSGKCPKVYAMWCEDGVCKNPDDPKPDPYPYGHAQWLLENKTDFGPNLWDRFVDKDKMSISKMGGNHFSMMKAPHVQNLVTFLREALC